MSELPAGHSILDFIGATPAVRLQRVVPPGAGEVNLKLELLSPNGTTQDRVALALIEEAEAEGRLKPGTTVICATAGNTGAGLAMLCAMRGYPLQAVMPEHMSLEYRQLLRAYEARVELTPVSEGMEGARARATALAASTPKAVLLDQFESPAAVEVHERTTGPELVRTVMADGGRIDAFVCGVGSGALLTAMARTLRAYRPQVLIAAAEPTASPVLSPTKGAPHRQLGVGVGGALSLLDRTLVGEVLPVADEEAWEMKQRLGKEEGLLVGISTGANVVAAVRLAQRLGPQARIYSVAHDTGERYFSMAEQFK